MDFTADQMCFACGRDNPIGLHLTFRDEGDRYVTIFTALPAHQGYKDIVHGGIIATLLDEIMARYVWVKYGAAATARLEIRYRRPVPTGQPITVRGWITAIKRDRIFELAADACLEDGTVLVEATSTVVRREMSPSGA